MIVGQMQGYFLPYIGYWQLLNYVDIFVVCDDLQFIRQGWVNRNNILINGQKNLFTLSLKRDNHRLNISQRYLLENNGVEIDKILARIKYSYKRAPYFNLIYPMIEDIFLYKDKNLFNYIYYSIKKVCEYLDINTKIIISSDIKIERNLNPQDGVIAVNKKLNSPVYINAIGGTELYSKEEMKKQGIDLFFLKTNIVEYRQFKNKFVPYLSIIDIMMFNSKEEIKNMLENYELI